MLSAASKYKHTILLRIALITSLTLLHRETSDGLTIGELVRAQYQESRQGVKPTYHLSAIYLNTKHSSLLSKASLTLNVITTRLAQFAGRHNVIITNAPIFNLKAPLASGSKFVVGYVSNVSFVLRALIDQSHAGKDTAIRIIDPKYYSQSEVKIGIQCSTQNESLTNLLGKDAGSSQ